MKGLHLVRRIRPFFKGNQAVVVLGLTKTKEMRCLLKKIRHQTNWEILYDMKWVIPDAKSQQPYISLSERYRNN